MQSHGWNSYEVDELKPKYKHYRLRSKRTDHAACDGISEIRFIGYEVIDDDSHSYSCPVELIKYVTDPLLQKKEEQRTSLSETVTYEIARTPAIDDINPRWGAVSG